MCVHTPKVYGLIHKYITILLYMDKTICDVWDASPTSEVPNCTTKSDKYEWSLYLSVGYKCSLFSSIRIWTILQVQIPQQVCRVSLSGE